MSETIIRPDTEERLDRTDSGDHDRFAHYVFGRNPSAKVTEAMVTGKPIRALCGKKWVPSRDASRFPICPQCRQLKAKLQRRPD